MSFVELVEDMRSTTQRVEKEDYLNYHDNDFNRFLLRETFDPNLLHNVKLTKKSIPEEGEQRLEDNEYGVRNLFDMLSKSQSSKQNKLSVQALMTTLFREDQEVLLGVVNKKLQMGASIRTLNKVWPGFIDVKPIQLANKYDPKKKYKLILWSESFKLDGVRVFCFRLEDGWHIYSRAKDYIGKELFTLEHWKPELERYYSFTGSTYIEGEAYKHGWDFNVIQGLVFSIVNLKERAKELEFHAFISGDCNGEIRCDSNLTSLSVEEPALFEEYSYLFAVGHRPLLNKVDAIKDRLAEAVELGYEGIMLRDMTKVHSPKRDNFLLKCKSMYFKDKVDKWDCEIVAVEFDDFTIQENGVITTEHLPVRLIVEQPEGTECAVGSGFKLPFRRWLAAHHEEVVSKTAEIEFCGLGAHGRMRFPVYQRIREDV